ncbi:Glucose-methanol-choline oxidoreductase N-terminal domain-containing protein [Madurella fahalii]|uniref:Glucose-methanol-choline oxidoreductase N-terminal domain-containing protein n=1 Tax=Madurella fahalii TaxID=1157608 RepID=A0ABQ0GKX3_9PEZI
MGIRSNPAHLDGSNIGVWTTICAVNPESGTRSYAAHYCSPPPANLHILTQALVEEVVLEQRGCDGWTATGVRFIYHGKTFTVSAAREVILSAGSVQSPQLLELSGVGRPDVLSVAKIPLKVDSPNVGENLQEHIMLPLIFEVDPELAQSDDLLDKDVLAAALEQYLRDRSGPLTVLPCSMSYLPVSQFVTVRDLENMLVKSKDMACFRPDQRSILSSRFAADKKLGQVEYVFDLGNWNPSFHPDAATGKRYCTMLQILQYPFSRGSIHIIPNKDGSESSASQQPAIDPQYYTGPHGELDLEVMIHGARFAQDVCRTKPLSDIIRGPAHPSESVTAEEDLRAWITQNTITDWHPIGTCAMGGREGRAAGVVDERLRVYGVRGLRVVDASIMPLHISAHLQATVYAIAEKAADMIIEDIKGG